MVGRDVGIPGHVPDSGYISGHIGGPSRLIDTEEDRHWESGKQVRKNVVEQTNPWQSPSKFAAAMTGLLAGLANVTAQRLDLQPNHGIAVHDTVRITIHHPPAPGHVRR